MDDKASQKETMREEAKRTRSFLSLDSNEYDALKNNFFDKIPVKKGDCIAAYWPKGRELDTHTIIDEALERGFDVCLPIVQKDEKVLKFARYENDMDMIEGAYKIVHPVLSDKTGWLEPDIVIVPMLAYDRKGYRLGYGGGYYDATLKALKEKKNILAVGLAYAKQACLFNLPVEEHDVPMDWIVTEQGVQKF
ncbi:MAG: 5-formyltetrahydrofolate cyclo-ligase [Alphaproteobacteria bacterium]|nr:5-formyltetrahydrofolate cyclo-ligase [Alphaproteobacteria bacterium]